ncbi:heptosyltransferase-2 [Flavobacteriaceae bacterium MAR_2010_188]|nr:heptosyltransferase-2 [Flavobacteriaceae bacterium MAR_2010_188]
MKVLIIQQKMIGDVLTSTVLFEELKDKHPISELHYLINENTAAVVENNPFIDKVKIVSKETIKDSLKFYSLIKNLRSEHYEIIIDAYGKMSSLSVCLAINASKKIGYYKSYSRFIYTHPIKRLRAPENHNSLAIENRLRLLLPLNMEFNQVLPKIYLSDVEKDEASNFLKSKGIDLDKPLIMISVLGSNLKKSYPNNYMALLLDFISRKIDCQMLFNYIPTQLKEVQDVYRLCNEKTQSAIKLDVYAKSLRSFLGVTSFCDAMIGNEGGANNMAKALNIPTFSIFNPHLNKRNWFGKFEEKKHTAIHLRDYIAMSPIEIKKAKKNPTPFYLKLNPELVTPKLEKFIETLNL